MSTHTTTSPEDTQTLAADLVAQLGSQEGIRGTSTIVALKGDLGAGKTMFVKGAATALGVQEVVTSPTFVIEKIYRLPPETPWQRLVHIDAYRLSNKEELTTIGWQDIATDPHNLIMIEWPEQVGTGVPERAVWLDFTTVDDHTRTIESSIEIEQSSKDDNE